ncbi:MAG: molecular chaperone TorD family protein [Methylococcaceae bacterium]|nr:molecular chaperone TorD family protein [Methylococcaceae bacterium]
MTDENLSRHEHDLWRANTYHLLARLLAAPPDHRLVAQLGEIPPLREGSMGEPMARAWSELGETSRRAREKPVTDEFHALFGDPQQGGLIPHASWYRSGAIDGKPLALLRAELIELGIGRIFDNTEDHVGAVCEVMCRLIESEDPRQIGFFARHLAPWGEAFFRDLRQAPLSDFYRPVGALGEAFLEIERLFLTKIC